MRYMYELIYSIIQNDENKWNFVYVDRFTIFSSELKECKIVCNWREKGGERVMKCTCNKGSRNVVSHRNHLQ